MLTEQEMNQVANWAKANEKWKLLGFFSDLPRRIVIPRPTLLGSEGGNDFLVHGDTVTSAVIGELYFLDDHYFDDPSGIAVTKEFSRRQERFDGDFWQAINEGQRHDPGKLCLAAHLGECTKPIVSAHSIQESELRSISRADGHVYGFLFAGKHDHRNFSWPEPVGVNRATTFTGVCSHHDNLLFREIETKPFLATKQQLFLFHYRSLLFEHYRRNHRYEKLKAIYNRLDLDGHAPHFESIKRILESNSHDVREIEAEKLAADQYLTSGKLITPTFACWTSDSEAPFAGTIAIGPQKDFLGRRVQSPASSALLKWITLTITPKAGKTVVIIGANFSSGIMDTIVRSFDTIPPDDRMQVLISYCLCCMEDMIIAPRFWESLNETQKEAIVRTYKARLFPLELPSLGKWRLDRMA